jgi:hypothetical protein
MTPRADIARLDRIRQAADNARAWTEDRDVLVRQAVAAGASLRTVGAVAGLSHGAIAKIVARG